MAITCSLAFGNTTSARSGQPVNLVLAVTNNGSNTIEVLGIQVTEASTMGAIISGPYFLTPNADVGVGPTILTTATAYYPCQVVVTAINTPGASPNSPNALHDDVFPPGNSLCRLQCDVLTYDSVAAENVAGSATFNFPVGSAVAPFPVPQGGAMQFNAGGNAVNWILF